MKYLIALFAILFCTSFSLAQSSVSRLLGTWHLESWITGSGAPRCSESEGQPWGQIIYSEDGYMSVQLGCSGIEMPEPESINSREAVQRVFQRLAGYHGPYSINESDRTVTHHVRGSSDGSMDGRDLVRIFNFEDTNTISLTTPGGGKLLWIRK